MCGSSEICVFCFVCHLSVLFITDLIIVIICLKKNNFIFCFHFYRGGGAGGGGAGGSGGGGGDEEEGIEMQVLNKRASETPHCSPRTSSIEPTIGSEDSNESTDSNQAAGGEPPNSTIGKSYSFQLFPLKKFF